jgi:hypothetical protein
MAPGPHEGEPYDEDTKKHDTEFKRNKVAMTHRSGKVMKTVRSPWRPLLSGSTATGVGFWTKGCVKLDPDGIGIVLWTPTPAGSPSKRHYSGEGVRVSILTDTKATTDYIWPLTTTAHNAINKNCLNHPPSFRGQVH